jgi:hypothetical protein
MLENSTLPGTAHHDSPRSGASGRASVRRTPVQVRVSLAVVEMLRHTRRLRLAVQHDMIDTYSRFKFPFSSNGKYGL